MSIAVYFVDPTTGQRTPKLRERFIPGGLVDRFRISLLTHAWPACRCPRCSGATDAG